VFYGLSGFVADVLAILGPVVILGVEIPRFAGWLERRRLDPILHPAIADAIAAAAPVAPLAPASGLLDPERTERIRVSEWLRGETTQQASSDPASERRESGVLVGGGDGSSEAWIRGSRGRE
jgi:hypothetical protein